MSTKNGSNHTKRKTTYMRKAVKISINPKKEIMQNPNPLD